MIYVEAKIASAEEVRTAFRAGVEIDFRAQFDDPKVAVINEAMAKRFWPGGSALGKKGRFDGSDDWCEVIGVVGDVRISPYFVSPVSRFQIYRSLSQYPSSAYGILLRSPRSPGDLSKSVREAVAMVNPDISLSELGGVADSIRSKVADASSEKIVSLGAFALVGLLEAMVGLYGVISQLTVQRTREIGIRVALGAGYSSVVRLIMAQGARVVSCGLALGIVGAYGVMTFYHATEPELPLPGLGFQLAVALLLGAAALTACFLPARRAGKVDPLLALRAE